EDPLPPAPRRSLASFGTHDLPTFAGYWRGLDIGDRRRRDLIDPDEAATERRRRARWRSALLGSLPTAGLAALPADGAAAEERRALAGVLGHLAAGQAEVVMVDLEDLWLEHEPQNRPGSGPEEGNFRRRATRQLEDVVADAGISAVLREVDARRRPELERSVGLPAEPPPARPTGGTEPETSDRGGRP
ncbi:MAG: 4-alpha-glucanotransferase, partial [Acidobacteriota bacterium]|nr:4-alpha-glucanotransferase [Acidobacteriota bacterium]